MDRLDRRKPQHLLSELSAELDEQRVVKLALDLAVEALDASAASSRGLVRAGLLFFRSGTAGLHVAQSRGFTLNDLGVTGLTPSGVMEQAITSGQPLLARDPGQDPGLSRFSALQACGAVFCLPMKNGPDISGIMLFGHPDRTFFDRERREFLELLARQTAIAIQNARRFQDLEAEIERLVKIKDGERARFARELHDGPTQSISAIAMRVNIARRLLGSDPDAAANELSKIEALARRITREMRYMLFTVRPLVLETHGLAVALQSLAEKLSATYDQNVIIEADEQAVTRLETGKQAILFSIVVEALTNVRKHAQASQVWVRLKTLETELSLLEIEDDGIGFDPAILAGILPSCDDASGRLGLADMHARAKQIGGELRVDAAKGRGTRIQVWIPQSGAAAVRIRHRQ